jgi:hypothetical protein
MKRICCGNQSGLALLVIVLILLALGVATLLVTSSNINVGKARRAVANEETLRRAKEALVSYAAGRRIDSIKPMPGTLPCPDLDDDGDAEISCGNAVGSTQQSSRIGRLPWKTLGLEDLRDASGERLWYAVSSKYKENTPNSDLNPSTGLGTITLRNPSGVVILDGTSSNVSAADAGGAVAIIIAPGAVLQRQGAALVQNRTCVGGNCDVTGKCLTLPASATPKCDPKNYLDIGAGEDNADFVDRNDVRIGNSNGFIQGPISVAGSIIVNDQITAVRYGDIMTPVQQRVAQEVKKCLSEYASLNRGRFPWPAPICRQASNPIDDWNDHNSVLFGRVPDTPFVTTLSQGMSGQWGATDCNINSGSGWWPAWKKHVFYAVAPAYAPALPASGNGGPCGNVSSCLQVQSVTGAPIADNRQLVVLVAGPPTSSQLRSGKNDAYASNYLELSNRDLEGLIVGPLPTTCSSLVPPVASIGCSPLSNCNTATLSNRQSGINDVVVYYP